MAADKILLTFGIGLLAFASTVNAQKDKCVISMTDFRIPGMMTIGTYSQLIESHGQPQSRFVSFVNPINPICMEKGESIAPKEKVQCEHLVYDAYEYIQIGDSVQLIFVDLRKLKIPVYVKDKAITSNTTQKDFLLEMTRMGLWEKELCQFNTGFIEYHYCTRSRVKNYLIEYKEDPHSSVVFTFNNCFYNKKIWWVEFPIMRLGGIVH